MRIVKLLLYGLFPCLLWSCEKEGTDQQYVEVPEGFALSAGTATNFLTSSKAYDFEASWLSGIYSSRFNDGDGLYDDVRTSSNQDGGLGPVYAGYSCGSCHRNAGRTKPTLWSEGGSGNYGFSSMLVYITRKNGAFFQNYGRVLHDQAIYGDLYHYGVVCRQYPSGRFVLFCPYTVTSCGDGADDGTRPERNRSIGCQK